MMKEEYQSRLNTLLADGGRKVLGIVGPPGSGKSWLAEAMHQLFPTQSVVVPMDGYHLANVELARTGKAGRKGAQDTFDSAGYIALLSRLRHQAKDEIVYAPEFRREIEEPIANAIPVHPDTQLVITEGNYLLLEEGHWAKATSYLDEVWYVEVDQALRLERLVKRHMQFGRTQEEAVEWVKVTDEPNARLIESTKGRADVIFSW